MGIVLFGGQDGNYKSLGDTWVWNGGRWTDQAVPGPSARYGASVAPFNGAIVMFGGSTTVENIPNDTWEWGGTAWSKLSIAGSPDGPTVALGRSIVLVGDLTDAGSAGTWTWDGRIWTLHNVPGPSPRSQPAIATAGGTIVLFGGGRGEGLLDDTWTWDGASWTQHNVPGPSPRGGASAAGLNGGVVLFGGLDSNNNSLGDTWTWDGTRWTAQNVAGPAARWDTAMATLNGTVLLFGGANENSGGFLGVFDDTWVWDGTTWTQQNVIGPGGRCLHAMSGLE
jgi:N-acetylneuraminic acid mutarotase